MDSGGSKKWGDTPKKKFRVFVQYLSIIPERDLSYLHRTKRAGDTPKKKFDPSCPLSAQKVQISVKAAGGVSAFPLSALTEIWAF